MSLLGGTPVLAPFPSFVVALKKKLLNKRRTRSPKQVVRLRLFFPLWSVSLGSEMPFQAVVLSSDRKLRTASRRQHCAAQEAREQEKRGGNFLFPFPLWFVYLFDLSTSPSRLSSRQLLGQRWVTHVASPRLLKGCGHGGVTVQKSLSICAKGLIHQRHGGILAAACGLYPTGAARRSRGVTDDEGETIPALSRLLLNMWSAEVFLITR